MLKFKTQNNRSVFVGLMKVGDLMNVCGYVRVSSDGQTENYSIPQQQKAIRSYCKAKAMFTIG